jgi:hypothetical protein
MADDFILFPLPKHQNQYSRKVDISSIKIPGAFIQLYNSEHGNWICYVYVNRNSNLYPPKKGGDESDFNNYPF